ncbi:MAG: hypothetical protein V4760_08110 [Bdellovibrionota bacterium]
MRVRQFCLGFAALVVFATQAQAATTSGFSCIDLRKASQRLQVHANNIMNANTTRTPQGGPYKAIELRCKEMYCESIPRDDFKLVYDPSHPDANKAGYVQFPRVELSTEFAALNSAATEVKLLASTGVCGASALSTGTTALVKYDAGTSILTDVLNFSSEGKLTSWSRTNRDGKADHFSFNSDALIAKGPEMARAPTSAAAAQPAAATYAPPVSTAPVAPTTVTK